MEDKWIAEQSLHVYVIMLFWTLWIYVEPKKAVIISQRTQEPAWKAIYWEPVDQIPLWALVSESIAVFWDWQQWRSQWHPISRGKISTVLGVSFISSVIGRSIRAQNWCLCCAMQSMPMAHDTRSPPLSGKQTTWTGVPRLAAVGSRNQIFYVGCGLSFEKVWKASN